MITGKLFHIDCEFEGKRLIDDVRVLSEPLKYEKKVYVYSPKLRANIMIFRKELR